jgi:hypothetical protein
MTQAKKLKKRIRARARKTGESYTAARRRILEAKTRRRRAAARAPAPPATPPGQAKGAVSDAASRQRTGHGLDHWLAVLDAFGGREKGHTAAARHLSEDHGVDGWYAQGITVAWERARGVRQPHQRSDGTFEVSVSRVLAASLPEVAALINDSRRRGAWLAEVDALVGGGLEGAFHLAKPRRMEVRPGKDARLRYPVHGRTVEVALTARPAGRSSIVATSMKLANAAAVEQHRAAWRRAFDALQGRLASS